MKTLIFFNLPVAYLWWHYTKAWGDFLRLYLNFFWFLSNFFSIKILSGTLLAPWKRLRESRGGRGDGGFAGRLILNSITRAVGFLLRSGTILMGVFSLVLLSLAFLLFLLFWLFAPFVACAFIVTGIGGLLTL